MESPLNSLWFFVSLWFWRFLSNPPAVPSDLASKSVEELNRLRDALIPFRDADLHLLTIATILVTVGVLMEIVEIQHDVRNAVQELKGPTRLSELNPWWKIVVALGWVLVAGGLCLEWWGDARITSANIDLDRVNQAIVDRTQGEAIAARQAASKAQGSADKASTAAGTAQRRADAADIAAGRAQKKASEAESQLIAALQRTAKLEAQLSWRTVTPEEKIKLRNLLVASNRFSVLPLLNLKIEITYTDQDPEAEEYADELKDALDGLGAEMLDPSGVLTVSNKPMQGVIVSANPRRNPAALSLLRSLSGAGISVVGQEELTMDERTVRIFVGPKPRTRPDATGEKSE